MLPTLRTVEWGNVPAVLMGVLAVWGLAYAVFGSYLRAVIVAWVHNRVDPDLLARMRLLSMELHTGQRADVRVGRGDPLTAGQPLTRDEWRARRLELLECGKRTRFYRAAMFLLNCRFCQNLEVATVMLAAAWEFRGPLDLAVSAGAYAAAATWIANRAEPVAASAPGAFAKGKVAAGGGCPTCSH